MMDTVDGVDRADAVDMMDTVDQTDMMHTVDLGAFFLKLRTAQNLHG
jgi:hypothetical protein